MLDPLEGIGFVWANVDRSSDFGLGEAPCAADCHQPPDGAVDTLDLLAMLAGWGADAGGPCDVDFDGVVDTLDLFALLGAWGPCPSLGPGQPATPGSVGKRRGTGAPSGRSADLNGDGRVDRADLDALQSSWGACPPGAPADLDRDGHVRTADFVRLLAQWSPARR